MEWTEAYSVGVSEIDDQHKRLFELITTASALEARCDEQELHDEIVRMLVKLNLYTIYHFETEERLMEANGYVETTEHKREHQAFANKLEQMHPEADELKSIETLHEIAAFLENWIKNHILKTDFKYKPLMIQKIEDGTFVTDPKSEPFIFPEELDELL
ncbi:MAG: hemerythrin [Clostridiales bacterium]|nr:hemerythrin [Clostridiales bacterium]